MNKVGAICAAVIGLAIGVGSLLPADRVATDVSDVWLHGLGYAALGAAVGLALMGRGRSAWLIAWCAITGYGLMLEVLQSLTPTRSFEIKDIGVDGIGAALGLGLTWALTNLGYRLRSGASNTRPPRSDTA